MRAQVATLVRADWLFLLTDVDALYTANPSVDPGALPIPEVHDLEQLQVASPSPPSCYPPLFPAHPLESMDSGKQKWGTDRSLLAYTVLQSSPSIPFLFLHSVACPHYGHCGAPAIALLLRAFLGYASVCWPSAAASVLDSRSTFACHTALHGVAVSSLTSPLQ